jgi:hypothetical protein
VLAGEGLAVGAEVGIVPAGGEGGRQGLERVGELFDGQQGDSHPRGWLRDLTRTSWTKETGHTVPSGGVVVSGWNT